MKTLIHMALFTALTLPMPAKAGKWQHRFHEDSRWKSPPTLRVHRYSVPAGSERDRLRRVAFAAFRDAGGLHLPVGIEEVDVSVTTFNEFDRRSDFAFVDTADIDGLPARTRTRAHWPEGGMLSADMMFASDRAIEELVDPTHTFRNTYLTAAHEVGHFFGLAHDFEHLNLMRQQTKAAVPGHDAFLALFPDDLLTLDKHYSRGDSPVDVFASAQVFSDALPRRYARRFLELVRHHADDSDYEPENGAHVISYMRANNSRRWSIFNPSERDCFGRPEDDLDPIFSDPDCVPVNGRDGYDEPRVLELCPGERLYAPYTIGNRVTYLGDRRRHHVAFYLGDADEAHPEGLREAFVDAGRPFDSTGLQIHSDVEELQLNADPDCAPPGDYRVWFEVDACDVLYEAHAAGHHEALEANNLLRTQVLVDVLPATHPRCVAANVPAADGVCEEGSGHTLECPDPDPDPDDPVPDFSHCNGGADPDDPSNFGLPGCPCADTFDVPPGHLDELLTSGAYSPDGAGSYAAHGSGGRAQYCMGEDVVCDIVNGRERDWGICTTCVPNEGVAGCPCFDDGDCGVFPSVPNAVDRHPMKCWGKPPAHLSEPTDDEWVGATTGICLPNPELGLQQEREIIDLEWFCLDSCEAIDPGNSMACVYDQMPSFPPDDYGRARCVDVSGTCDGAPAGACEYEDGEAGFCDPDRGCEAECDPFAFPPVDCHEDRRFPSNYACDTSLAFHHCVPEPCLGISSQYCSQFSQD